MRARASSWYDGSLVDHDYPISGFNGFLLFQVWLSHDENDGSGPEVAWIDNVAYTVTTSVPEIDPAGNGSALALVCGALGLLERQRARRRRGRWLPRPGGRPAGSPDRRPS